VAASVGLDGFPAPDTLRLAEAIAEALRANPMLRAARLRADAISYRTPQSGALPDPMLVFGLRNRPLDGFGTDERMTMNVIEISQRFPWPGSLGFSEEGAGHTALAVALEADDVEASLAARVTGTYYEIAALDRSADILRDTRDLLLDFERVTTARYEVGEGVQQDILQARIAVGRTTADLEVLAERRVAGAARLNALLGRPATDPVGDLELPAANDTIPSIEHLMSIAATRRPALLAAREKIRAAEAHVRAAHRASYPDVSLMLGYGQRPQYADMASITVGVSLPLWSGSKQTPRRREAEVAAALEQARSLDLYNETFARLSELRAAARRSLSLVDLYRTSILPQAHAAVESALSAYRVGKVDYMTLLSSQMTVNRYETELVMLTAETHATVARISALTGEEAAP
jgi:outer membrane protein TolC